MKDWMGVSSITTLDEFGFILATQLLLRRISLKLCRSNRLKIAGEAFETPVTRNFVPFVIQRHINNSHQSLIW
jgi:hypothetical protein